MSSQVDVGGADVDGGVYVGSLLHPSSAPIDDLTQSSTTIQNRCLIKVIVYLTSLLK